MYLPTSAEPGNHWEILWHNLATEGCAPLVTAFTPQAVLGWGGRGTVVVSFRGTASMQNVMTDIKVRVGGLHERMGVWGLYGGGASAECMHGGCFSWCSIE